MKKLLRGISQWAACLGDVLYPPHCIVCESGLIQGEIHICISCLSTLPTIDEESYSPESLYQRLSIELQPSFAWAYLLFDNKNKTQKILHAIKYGDTPDLAVRLAAIWASRIENSLRSAEIDYIMPIPLHGSKKRTRGYNQATMIAEGMCQIVPMEMEEQVLYRKQNLFVQARSKRSKRFENVKQVYAIRNMDRVIGKHVLLVDDVLTTGATLEACGLLLKQAGAAKVSVALLAMVAD